MNAAEVNALNLQHGGIRCEATRACADDCCPPERCPNPAAARVSFRCRHNGCDHAADLLLLCGPCTEQAADIGPVLARRPL